MKIPFYPLPSTIGWFVLAAWIYSTRELTRKSSFVLCVLEEKFATTIHQLNLCQQIQSLKNGHISHAEILSPNWQLMVTDAGFDRRTNFTFQCINHFCLISVIRMYQFHSSSFTVIHPSWWCQRRHHCHEWMTGSITIIFMWMSR